MLSRALRLRFAQLPRLTRGLRTRRAGEAFAYVRPHDIDVQPYTPQAALGEGKGEGIIAKLDRAIVIGPIARLELIPKDDSRPAGGPLVETLIEAQLPAQQFRELGLREGDTVVLTPRKARVFVDAGVGI